MSNVFGFTCMVLLMLFSITKTDEDVKNKCDTYKDCHSCTTDHNCQFVTWESKERNVTPFRKCVDIKLDSDAVRKLGPYGNENNDTHWDMKPFHDKDKCIAHHVKALHKLISKVAASNTTQVPSPITQGGVNASATLNPVENVPQFDGINRTSTNITTTQESKVNKVISDDLKLSSRIIKEKADLIQNGVYPQGSFDVGSFIGGMVLIIVLNVVCVFGIRFYKARGSRNYNYLLWGDSSN